MVAGGRCLGGKQSSDHPRTDQETENVDQDDICAVGRHCSEHRRYSIGCDQETKSLSQRPTGSGHRSAHRPTFQSLQSRSHRRWYPWLQSNARALLNCLSIKRRPHRPKAAFKCSTRAQARINWINHTCVTLTSTKNRDERLAGFQLRQRSSHRVQQKNVSPHPCQYGSRPEMNFRISRAPFHRGTPCRPRNADLREREYLTPKEVDRLQDAARKHSRMTRESPSRPFHVSQLAVWIIVCLALTVAVFFPHIVAAISRSL
jgi:hypothetical protein